ncbi:hypothetical protein TcCL_NonESM11588 [Trypanosoma cruzi]|nr:hypothetical protein TcCL_NonESM11588 [Trypanosoma cruzi]
MCPHTVDGQAHSAAGWAGGRQSAARWSTRSRGAHVGKRFRRRQRQAGHRSEGGTAPPTQRVPCDPQGACRPVEEWAGVASRLCAVPPLGDRCPGQHQEQSPRHTDRRLSRGVRALLFLLGILPVPSLHGGEKFHVPGIDAVLREGSCNRAMTASASAVTLRGISQCDGKMWIQPCDLNPPVNAARYKSPC